MANKYYLLDSDVLITAKNLMLRALRTEFDWAEPAVCASKNETDLHLG